MLDNIIMKWGELHMLDQTLLLLGMVFVLIIMFVIVFTEFTDAIGDRLAKRNVKARKKDYIKKNNVVQIVVLTVAYSNLNICSSW